MVGEKFNIPWGTPSKPYLWEGEVLEQQDNFASVMISSPLLTRPLEARFRASDTGMRRLRLESLETGNIILTYTWSGKYPITLPSIIKTLSQLWAGTLPEKIKPCYKNKNIKVASTQEDQSFWGHLENGGFYKGASEGDAISSFLNGEGGDVHRLTNHFKKNNPLVKQLKSGSRVGMSQNTGTLLTYDFLPRHDEHGTIVKVRTSEGDTISHEGRFFVKWDSGELTAVLPEHLELRHQKLASSVRINVRTAFDLNDFMKSSSDNELVHKASRDLWKMSLEGDQVIIERLFDEEGDPLKV